MTSYYVDTSVIVAIVFSELNASKYKQLLLTAEDILSSFLLEAEFFSAIAREKRNPSEIITVLDNISFMIPSRSLREEFNKIFRNGYCRGSDAFHVACALYLDPDANDLQFLTADEQQRKIALSVGFKSPKI